MGMAFFLKETVALNSLKMFFKSVNTLSVW